MKTIEVTVRLEMRLTKALTDAEFANLENGMDIENFVDESNVYRRLSSEGECEMEWDVVGPVKTKAKPKRKKK